jgi:hypothetical protein
MYCTKLLLFSAEFEKPEKIPKKKCIVPFESQEIIGKK